MKKIFSVISLLVVLLSITSCAKDIDNDGIGAGSITGVVKDDTDAHLISNCTVTLMPGGNSCLTGTEGAFSFNSLPSGSYNLSFTKAGYNDLTKTVSVISGKTTDASVTLKSKGAFLLSETTLDFGDMSTSMSVNIINNSDTKTNFTITNIPSWASCSQTEGTVAAESSSAISFTVNRDNQNYGTYSQVLVISYKGNSQGSVSLTLNMQKVQLTKSTIEISTSAQEVTQNSFKIGGKITACGGAEVTDYGHCWSTSHNPTLEGAHASQGSTKAIGEFITTATDLSIGTTYYVRAYAVNSQGTSYSSEVAVTTQEPASSKWDGNIATTFAGGSGTAGDPYQVNTGGQLLLMKDYNDKYFTITGNIDLDNHNWLPFEFKGTLAGNGYTISNLYINRTDDNQGLFSILGSKANIQNLNIKGVKISAGSNNCIGTLAGKMSYASGAIIDKIHVILTENSKILGNKYVGGLIGYIDGYAGGTTITNNTVNGVSSDYQIVGDQQVGGMLGHGYGNNSASGLLGIDLCSVQVNIKGGNNVGGIIGYNSGGFYVGESSFKGNISGIEYVGGVTGYGSANIIACRSNANINGTSSLGGIAGSTSYTCNIIACYSEGKITGMTRCAGIVGFSSNSTHNLCYSIMTSTCSTFDGIACEYFTNVDCATTSSKASGTNTVANCKNITQHLKEAYSQYASYYNFNSTFTSEGVSCPRLAWETVSSSTAKKSGFSFKR